MDPESALPTETQLETLLFALYYLNSTKHESLLKINSATDILIIVSRILFEQILLRMAPCR